MKFPNTNIVRNVPRLPNSLVNYWGGQSIWTRSYWPQPAHSHRQHSLTRATTQEFLVFIRHPEPQLKRCYSEPQLKEHQQSHLWSITISLVDHAHRIKNTNTATVKSPGRGHVPPGAARFQTAWRVWWVKPLHTLNN